MNKEDILERRMESLYSRMDAIEDQVTRYKNRFWDMHCPECKHITIFRVEGQTNYALKYYRCMTCGKKFQKVTQTTLELMEEPNRVK